MAACAKCLGLLNSKTSMIIIYSLAEAAISANFCFMQISVVFTVTYCFYKQDSTNLLLIPSSHSDFV